MKDKGKIRLGISIGDINGIGCEVALKTFQDVRMLEFCTPVLFASNKTISDQKSQMNSTISFNGIKDASQAVDGKINVVNVWREAPKTEVGKATQDGGKYAIKSLRAAVADGFWTIKSGLID